MGTQALGGEGGAGREGEGNWGASGATKGYCNDPRVRVGPPRVILMTLIAPLEPPGDTVVTLGYQTSHQEIR